MEKIIFNNIEFCKIKDFDGYYVSKCGKVLSTVKYHSTDMRILKQYSNNKGYLFTNLGRGKSFLIHRLMCITFLNNKNNYKEVNHIDGNKLNNNLNNLEWTTRSKNLIHSYRILNREVKGVGGFGINHINSKKVKQLDLNGNLINIWDSVADAGRSLNKSHSNIVNCALNKKHFNTAYGFKWEYL